MKIEMITGRFSCSSCSQFIFTVSVKVGISISSLGASASGKPILQCTANQSLLVHPRGACLIHGSIHHTPLWPSHLRMMWKTSRSAMCGENDQEAYDRMCHHFNSDTDVMVVSNR